MTAKVGGAGSGQLDTLKTENSQLKAEIINWKQKLTQACLVVYVLNIKGLLKKMNKKNFVQILQEIKCLFLKKNSKESLAQF